MYKAKNIAKKIVTCSLVFALTATSMPIGLKASAATAPVLNKTAKTLYINSNEIGSSYDFNIKNKVSKSTYKWTTSNKSIATVDAEGLAKAGSETGKVTISCKITLPTKKTKTLKAIVTVKENADRVEITNPIETELGIGANVYDFDSAMTTASGAKATDYRMWEISSEGNTAGATVISSDGRVTTAHAGEFKIRVRAFQNNEKLAANKTVNSDWLTVKVVASAKSVSQTDSSKVVVTFDDDMKDKLQTSDFTITSKDGSRVMSITGLTYSEDGKAVTLEATSMFANNGEYILTYKGNQFNFSTLVKEEVSSYVPTSPSPNPPPTEQESGIRESLTALEVTKLMGNGINLGNTMEAYGKMYLGITAEVSAYETLWGMPVTTQEMISAMKAAGFDTLRIPVAWTNVMDYENGNYTIREDYLNRVEEIIKYAFNEDMYVIVNDHWDGGWWGMFGSATQSTRDAAMELYTSMWTQIANRYKEYSDYLIFESGNEELGSRLNDTDAPLTADSGTLSVDECYEMANQINQKFVEIIRSTGGNNAKRFLLIAGYNTDITRTCDDRFVMPTDTASNKLLISVHYYNPDGYTFNSSLSSWGTKSDFETQNMYMNNMTKFT
ncbi:cellulase family glycosylhydrolase [Anaerosporobacter sp.]|uniref:cellulase family glycosylhydrolase n=1 Tax=Anaerosporobacter sp. TaxID=1872529 RepID=UPI00286F40FE|nr:cellulase family glycosylhydrolase [Anaerosporobacter sp.]